MVESNYTQNHACVPGGGGGGKRQRPREEEARTTIPSSGSAAFRLMTVSVALPVKGGASVKTCKCGSFYVSE